MAKKLITGSNYVEYLYGKKFFVTDDIIVTPNAIDKLKADGIEIVYGKCECEIEAEKVKLEQENKCEKICCEELEKTIVEMLVKDFGIVDAKIIKNIVKKVKENL